MKRTCPVGYTLIHGVVVVDPDESTLVKKMYEMCISGKSLKQIADVMEPYFDDIVINKPKIARILSDRRYLGDELFEGIIDEDTFNKANSLKSGRATAPANPDKAEILGLRISVRCPVCGSRMKRFHVKKRKKQYWKCTEAVCKKTVYINDSDMIEQLKDVMYELTAIPYVASNDYIQKSINSATLEKNIIEQISSQTFDKNTIKERILELSEMLYMDIPNTGFVKMKIASSLNEYNEDQYLKTINEIGSKIEFGEDNTVSLVLRDGCRYVRKEHHADRREDNIVYRSYEANC